jgi:Phytanoyl-CoA dioxygenase (PhyH)
MTQLKISSLDSPIEKIRKDFIEEGYLFFKGFFPQDTINVCRNHILNVLHARGWGLYEDQVFNAKAPIHRINSEEFYDCLNELMSQEAFHELGHHSKLESFLNGLFDKEVFCHPRKMLRISYPFHLNPFDRVPPHQDVVYVKGELDTLTCWIPLGDYPLEQGGLEVSPKTHKSGLYPTQANSEGRFGCTAIEENLQEFTWLGAHYEKGDLLILHSLTLHRAGKNLTSQFRLSLDCRFSCKDGVINPEQLLPPYFPHVKSWNELAISWNKPNRFQLPQNIKLAPVNQSLDDVLNLQTIFCHD